MYKIRIILDTKEDVLRTLVIDKNCNLEQLHFAITNAFGFDGKEMASFYRTDYQWNQGEEIPLFNMEDDNGISMSNCILKDILVKENDKLIYVYDFLNMWSFYVELIEISNEKVENTKVILSVGDVPNEVPERKFEANNLDDEFDDEFKDMFDEFESLDDFDYDNY